MHKLLLNTRNILTKFLPENSKLYKHIVMLGIKIKVKKQHKRLKLLKIGVHATSHCNLNCKGCTAFSPLAEPSFLDVRLFTNDLIRLAELTNNRISALYISGGEPLLHPEIEDILNISRKYFIDADISMMTNGLKLLDMPDSFWNICKTKSIRILISRYPINININKINEKAKHFNLKISYVGGDNAPIKQMWKYPLDLNGKQPLKNSFDICTQVNLCMILNEGIIYPCNTIACIKHFSNYFNEKIELKQDDTLNIYNINSVEEILDFLCKPKPMCRFCNRKGLILGIKYQQSNREVSEWV